MTLPAARPLVVFVSGWGRSGSTVFEALVAQLPGAVGVGEVWNLWGHGVQRDQRCGCGRVFSECPFWTAVRLRSFSSEPLDGRATARRMRTVARVRALPRLLTGRTAGWRHQRDFEDYTATLAALYGAVSEVAGVSVIVDTSKNPQHGFLLRLVPGVDVTVVHLVRDARAVAFSWARERAARRPTGGTLPQRRPARSAVAWTAANLLSELLVRVTPGAIRVRYEDLCDDPEATIARVAAIAHLPAPSRGSLAGAVHAEVHAAAGNPVRLDAGPIELRLDDEWTRGPWRGRRLVTALTAPLLLRYGYPLVVRG